MKRVCALLLIAALSAAGNARRHHIINGGQMEWIDYPFYLSLRTPSSDRNIFDDPMCGASLVKGSSENSTRYAVTAAHCFFNILTDEGITHSRRLAKMTRVFTPTDTSTKSWWLKARKYEIAEMKAHPHYSKTSDIVVGNMLAEAGKHDVAVIELSEDIYFNDGAEGSNSIAYAKLDERKIIKNDTRLRVIGFGAQKKIFKKGNFHYTFPTLLLGYDTAEKSTCSRAFTGFDKEKSFCFATSNQTACFGDSGGPVTSYNKKNKMFKLIGIVSMQSADCLPGALTLASRVSYYADWIKGTIKVMEKARAKRERGRLRTVQIPGQF